MLGLLARRRYELVAVAVALICIVLHVRVNATRDIGLTRTEGGGALVRAIQLAEDRATDLKFRIRGPVAPDPAVVVVAVDEKSAQKFGLWPWPRYRIAKAMYENKPKLAESLKAFGIWDPKQIHKKMPADYHPGAVKFYKD